MAAYDPAVAGVRAGRQLVDAGFSREHAEAVVLAVGELAAHLATKADLEIAKSELRTEMAELGGQLRGEMAELKSELRAEMSELKSELRGEMAELKTELKSDIVQSEHRLESRMGELQLESKEIELRLTKAMNRNLLWAVGIINIVVIVGGLAIAVAVLIDALKV